MFALTPRGALINLNAVRWIEVTCAMFDTALFVVSSDIGELTEPGTSEEAEVVMAQIIQMLKPQLFGLAKGDGK